MTDAEMGKIVHKALDKHVVNALLLKEAGWALQVKMRPFGGKLARVKHVLYAIAHALEDSDGAQA